MVHRRQSDLPKDQRLRLATGAMAGIACKKKKKKKRKKESRARKSAMDVTVCYDVIHRTYAPLPHEVVMPLHVCMPPYVCHCTYAGVVAACMYDAVRMPLYA